MIPAILTHAIDHPIDGLPQRLAHHRSAGLPDGRQAFEGPRTRTAVAQLSHHDAVRQEDQVHVAGLATAFPELTIAHAQMLLAVPVEALGAAPAMAVHAENPMDLPLRSIRHEDFARRGAVPSPPQDDDPQRVVHAVDADAFGEVPLRFAIDDDPLAIFGLDRGRDFFGFERLALEDHLAVELQIADVAALVAVDVVEVGRVREPAIEGEITGDSAVHHPVHQVAEHRVVIDEGLALPFTMLAFDEPAEVQRVVLAAPRISGGGADVVGDQVVVGDLVALLGVVPEPADILDAFAGVVDQHVVDGDHAPVAVARGRVGLHPFEPAMVERFDVPVHLGQPAVETRLVGGPGELPADRRDVLAFCDQQPGQVLGEMPPRRLVVEQIAEVSRGFDDDGGELDDRRHGMVLRDRFGCPAISLYRQNDHEFACKN